MGLNQAHSNYACLYCTVHKDERYGSYISFNEYSFTEYTVGYNFDRWDVSKSHDVRTLRSIEHCLTVKSLSRNKGCINPPLLNIQISNIVVDELHLILRISDILIRNLVWAMVAKKQLPTLVDTIRSCGVLFQVY